MEHSMRMYNKELSKKFSEWVAKEIQLELTEYYRKDVVETLKRILVLRQKKWKLSWRKL